MNSACATVAVSFTVISTASDNASVSADAIFTALSVTLNVTAFA